MSMKKTDLEKRSAKKLDGNMKAGTAAQRFGQGTTPAKAKAEQKPQAAAPKSVQVTCRLPADVVAQLRERAAGLEGGMGAALKLAAEQWLAQAPGGPAKP